jgi:hypothetical protein
MKPSTTNRYRLGKCPASFRFFVIAEQTVARVSQTEQTNSETSYKRTSDDSTSHAAAVFSVMGRDLPVCPEGDREGQQRRMIPETSIPRNLPSSLAKDVDESLMDPVCETGVFLANKEGCPSDRDLMERQHGELTPYKLPSAPIEQP